jgi:hypothetical protein
VDGGYSQKKDIQFPVRGKRKVRAVALLQAVTYNLLKMTKLLGAPPG